jgi:ribonuclease BN (tRNA processing enzyme)
LRERASTCSLGRVVSRRHCTSIRRLVTGVTNAPTLTESILGHHTAVVAVGGVAQAAGVRTLVLSHLVPAEDPNVSDAMWLEAARTHFRGR